MDGRIQWHPAFCSALQIELADDAGALEFHPEYLLSKKPMQIDILVIKKDSGYHVRKKIGHIFRGHNIVEYKSPDDYLSLNDFYKVCGYSCFYQSDTEKVSAIDPGDITMTFVCNHYPEKLLGTLLKKHGIVQARYCPGIYHLTGGLFPAQLVITSQLSPEEYYWLQNFRRDLKAGGEIRRLLENYEPHKNSKLYQSVVDAILRANWEETEVERKMCEAIKELFAEDFKASHDQGLNEGLRLGRDEGLQLGRSEGLQQGRSEGLRQGRSEGLQQGRSEGLLQGRSEGLRQGRSEGLRQGRSEGLRQGRSEGLRQGRSEGLDAGRSQMKEALKLRLGGAAVEDIAEKLELPKETVTQMLEGF